MREERILVILIVIEVFLVIFGVMVEYGLEPTLPTPLRDYVAASEAVVRLTDALLTVFWISIVAVTVVSWIGLVNLVAAARPLYLVSWAAYFLLILFCGPVVTTAASLVVQLLTALVSGAVVGLIYLSDLRTKFRSLDQIFDDASASTA